jgi:ligand-binding sensor domain-containing protein
MAKYFKIFLILFSFPVFLTAQYEDFKFEWISVDHGLSNNIVYSILKNCRGYMWFGTEDGLNKYDEFNYTVYRHDPDDSLSTSGNWITTLHESHCSGKHVLWIGKFGGLNKFECKTEKFIRFQYDQDNFKIISSNMVETIKEIFNSN